jgi:hypothetical protein
MYLYEGSLIETIAAAGISIIAGFLMWHGDPDDVDLGDWESLFHGTVTTGGISVFIVSYAEFNKTPISTMTGCGLGIGGGAGWGFAGFRANYWGAEDWIIPLWLRGTVAPKATRNDINEEKG